MLLKFGQVFLKHPVYLKYTHMYVIYHLFILQQKFPMNIERTDISDYRYVMIERNTIYHNIKKIIM